MARHRLEFHQLGLTLGGDGPRMAFRALGTCRRYSGHQTAWYLQE